MKKILSIFLLLGLSLAWVSAGDNHETQKINYGYKTVVIDNDLDFEATRDNYKVQLSWDAYEQDDFKYYKIMKSTTHDNPVYPDQPAIKFLDNAWIESYTLNDWTKSSAVYRICVITQENARICSNTVKLWWYVHEKKEYIKEYGKEPTMCIQVIQPAYDPLTGKCKNFSTPCSVTKGWKKVSSCNDVNVIKLQEKKSHPVAKLDEKIQKRADKVVDAFIKKLEAKYKTDTSKKVARLENIVEKLAKMESKITSEKSKLLVSYLKEKLEIKKNEYLKKDDIEDIFKLLEE